VLGRAVVVSPKLHPNVLVVLNPKNSLTLYISSLIIFDVNPLNVSGEPAHTVVEAA
jgi:hypothetical protein